MQHGRLGTGFAYYWSPKYLSTSVDDEGDVLRVVCRGNLDFFEGEINLLLYVLELLLGWFQRHLRGVFSSDGVKKISVVFVAVEITSSKS